MRKWQASVQQISLPLKGLSCDGPYISSDPSSLWLPWLRLLIQWVDTQRWQRRYDLVGLKAHRYYPQDQVQDVLRITHLLGHVVEVVNDL